MNQVLEGTCKKIPSTPVSEKKKIIIRMNKIKGIKLLTTRVTINLSDNFIGKYV